MANQHPAIVVDAVVKDGSIRLISEDDYRAKCKRAAKVWGDGAMLRCRIEPIEDAIAYQQMKGYFGHVVGPIAEYTGYRKDEVHTMLKAQFMPDDGRTSITQLSYEEMSAYKEACEQWARTSIPDAFALHEPIGRTA